MRYFTWKLELASAFHFLDISYFVEVKWENEWETKKVDLSFLFAFDLI